MDFEKIRNKMDFEKSLTKIKDVDLKILGELDDYSLFSFCVTSKYGNRLCKEESFWFNRTYKKFGEHVTKNKSPDRNWRDYYLKLIYYINKYSPYSNNWGAVDAGKKGYLDIIQFLIEKNISEGKFVDINWILHKVRKTKHYHVISYLEKMQKLLNK